MIDKLWIVTNSIKMCIHFLDVIKLLICHCRREENKVFRNTIEKIKFLFIGYKPKLHIIFNDAG